MAQDPHALESEKAALEARVKELVAESMNLHETVKMMIDDALRETGRAEKAEADLVAIAENWSKIRMEFAEKFPDEWEHLWDIILKRAAGRERGGSADGRGADLWRAVREGPDSDEAGTNQGDTASRPPAAAKSAARKSPKPHAERADP